MTEKEFDTKIEAIKKQISEVLEDDDICDTCKESAVFEIAHDAIFRVTFELHDIYGMTGTLTHSLTKMWGEMEEDFEKEVFVQKNWNSYALVQGKKV